MPCGVDAEGVVYWKALPAREVMRAMVRMVVVVFMVVVDCCEIMYVDGFIVPLLPVRPVPGGRPGRVF